MSASKQRRLDEFLRRLEGAAPVSTEEEALDILGRILIAVEDELSGISFNSTCPLNDGRMYPPKADSKRSVEGRDDVTRYRSRSHNTFISIYGAIRIEEEGGTCLIDKAGRNGRRV